LTREHTDYPGINVIDLFQAPIDESSKEPIELEHARLRNPRSIRFLISAAVDDTIVSVTSQMGYDVSGEYSVDHLERAPELPVLTDMFDVARCDSRVQLTRRHVQRFSRLGGDPTIPLAQENADEIFRTLIQNTVEASS